MSNYEIELELRRIWKELRCKASCSSSGENGFWSLTGNSGTDYQTNFLGTTDVEPLMFRIGNIGSGQVGFDNTSVGLHALFVNNGQTGGVVGAGRNNTAFGISALHFNSTGNNNVAVGESALRLNVAGIDNVAVGVFALRNNLGSGNTGVGKYALLDNTTGANNTAMGYTALQSNISGDSNAAFGSEALLSNTLGDTNTAIGVKSLYANVSSNSNTAVGFESLTSTTSGNNTSLGYQAGDTNVAGTQNTFVGFQARGSVAGTSNSIALGSQASAVTNEFAIGTQTKVRFGSATLIQAPLAAYADNAAAVLAGLTTGQWYQTTGAGAAPLNVAGIVMIVQ